MRTIEYDQTADALYVSIGKAKGDVRTKKVGSGVYADYDKNGAVVGVEILNASKKVLADMIDRATPPSRLMTLAEAEEETGLAAITLRTQIRNGRLVATKKGRDWLVSSDDLAAYMESRHSPEPADYAMAGGSRDVPGVRSKLGSGELTALVREERERSADAIMKTLADKAVRRTKARRPTQGR